MRNGCLCFLAVATIAAGAGAEEPLLSDDVLRRIDEIRALAPDLREDSFSKMGGSSVVSKAFLTCFATDYVDLGEHLELADTIELFGAGRHNPFRRQSEAAGVSWNLRYVLGGRPANFREELRATKARWALVLFGSNDAQNENERVYLERLVYLVEEMSALGVVPILGSALPRRSRVRNQWIDRFNLITEAVAEHWSLPYIDYNAALTELPRKGLARDGVHPNVLPPGGLKNACVLTEEGLRYGNNVRNLLTLQTLHALTHPSPGIGPGPSPGLSTSHGAGPGPGSGPVPESDLNPIPPPPHLSLFLDKSLLPPASPLPRNCGTARAEARHYRTSFSLAERARMRVVALAVHGPRSRVLLVKHADDDRPARCVRRRLQTLEVAVPPGMWDLVIEVPEAAAKGELLLLVTPEPR